MCRYVGFKAPALAHPLHFFLLLVQNLFLHLWLYKLDMQRHFSHCSPLWVSSKMMSLWRQTITSSKRIGNFAVAGLCLMQPTWFLCFTTVITRKPLTKSIKCRCCWMNNRWCFFTRMKPSLLMRTSGTITRTSWKTAISKKSVNYQKLMLLLLMNFEGMRSSGDSADRPQFCSVDIVDKHFWWFAAAVFIFLNLQVRWVVLVSSLRSLFIT